MITIQDLYNIVWNKISNEMQKAIIRKCFLPQIAERMCASIDEQEHAKHLRRILEVRFRTQSWGFQYHKTSPRLST